MDHEPAESSNPGLNRAEHDTPADTRNDFPIVGIGASAGGLEALRQFIEAIPADSPMAFVVVQHLDPTHESQLAELLSASTTMSVADATQGAAVQPACVYVIPPNTTLTIADGRIHLGPRSPVRGPHLPIDAFFRSLALERRERSIGVVLSGTGADGTLGLCEIKSVGGITFAQDEKTAAHPGMPRSAVESGCVDFVLAPDIIARRLGEMGGHPYLASGENPEAASEFSRYYNKILSSVREATGVDFSQYRDTTIRRRILRRMALHSHRSLANYEEQLRTERDEVDALYRDLLINVTSFFRDPEMFETLRSRVFPEIIRGKTSDIPIRIWVPGCSTGQEAYSIAMTLVEFLDDQPVAPPIQIFATDLSDPTSLDRARNGVYPDTIEAEITPERLNRFFTKDNGRYRIDKSLRDMCVFARQNLIADPPFSRVDLVSCRNVLIYMSPTLQRRVMPMFNFALNVPGFLVLGSAETIGDLGDLFELVDRTHKVYSKKPVTNRAGFSFPVDEFRRVPGLALPRRTTAPVGVGDFQREADRVAIGHYAPPGVLVSDNFDVIQFRGRTADFLELPSGDPTSSVLKMARDGLFLDLRAALNDAKARNVPVERHGVRVRGSTDVREITIRVVPVRPAQGDASCYLVAFEDAASSGGVAGAEQLAGSLRASSAPLDSEELIRIREELESTKDHLQSMVEQQDAANQELRSANEEILSSNEELQSTNEELETAKEELQSANEELTTVNEQLQTRNLELNHANNDLTNIFTSTGIAVVMVGDDLRIRRITPPAQVALNLLPTDVGRPIADLKLNIDVTDLDALLTRAIESGEMQQRECRGRGGRWYMLRVHPYRVGKKRVDGAVITLLDVDNIKQNEEEIRRSAAYAETLVEQLKESNRRKDEFLAMLAHELRNPLTAIKNSVEIMRLSGAELPTMPGVQATLMRQVDQMVRLVGDLLDMSRIAEGKIAVKKEVVRVADLVTQSVEGTRAMYAQYGHELTVNIPSEDLVIRVDPTPEWARY